MKIYYYFFFIFFLNIAECLDLHILHFYEFPKKNWVLSCFLESASFFVSNSSITIHVNTDFSDLKRFLIEKKLYSSSINIKLHFFEDELKRYGLQQWNMALKNSGTKFYTQKITDALRLIYIYENGGIYMDQDHIFFSKIDLEHKIPFVSSFSKAKGSDINNSFFGFKQNEKRLLNLIRKIPEKNFFDWNSIGPVLFSE